MNENVSYPEAPAEIAQAVLEGIERNPDCFNMDCWIYRPDGDMIGLMAGPGYPPSANPWEDGTWLCAASWVAHVTGWTIQFGSSGLCSKGDDIEYIGDVARRALGLGYGQTFWFESDGAAHERLRDIADGFSCA